MFCAPQSGGSCYRVNANLRRRLEKRDDHDDRPCLDALHTDRWKQCCVCAKWRFVDEDSARLLQSESFFEQRDSDLDWARWLGEAWLGQLLLYLRGVGVEVLAGYNKALGA